MESKNPDNICSIYIKWWSTESDVKNIEEQALQQQVPYHHVLHHQVGLSWFPLQMDVQTTSEFSTSFSKSFWIVKLELEARESYIISAILGGSYKES